MKEDVVYLLGLKDAKFTAEKELEKNPCAVNAEKVFEYSKRIDEVLAKIDKDYDELNKYKEFEKGLGCLLEVVVAVFKAIQQGFIFVDLGNELYKEDNISLDYADISEDEEGYIGCIKSTNYHYILDYEGCVFVEDYKKTWWLKENREE